MKTIRLTMAQALIRFLENQYVSYDNQEHRFVRGIFMLPGHGNVLGLGQAIQQEVKNLEVYYGKNEQGQCHAAIAYAKQMHRKQIFACTSSVGPGAANMVTAAATATANNIPLLLLPGDTFASRQPDPVLQQIEQPYDLGISTNDAFRPVCRYWDRIVRPEQLMTAMINAMRVLTDPANTGAVCIALPQDVQAEAYDYPEEFFKKRIHYIERRPPTKSAIIEASNAIKNSVKPLLICGGGVRYSEANDTFLKFAERHNIPFGETQAGKSAIPYSYSLNLGGIGITGTSAANEIAKEADLIIGVGTRYTDFTTASKWLFREDAKFVNINISDYHAYKMDGIRVIADAKIALEALSESLGDYKSGYTNEVDLARSRWFSEVDRLSNLQYNKENYEPEVNDANKTSVEEYIKDLESQLTQTRALGIINSEIAPDSVVIGASGSLPGCMQRMWKPSVPNTYNMEYGYSCMGYEIAGALGVKIAIGKNREVYALVGDGSFNMLHSELITAVQEGLKINVLLFDNAGYGCINNLQVGQGNDNMGTELRYRNGNDIIYCKGRFMNINYAQIAEAYGCKGYSVKTEEELKAALNDAKLQKCSTLIDIKVLPKSMTDGYGSWWNVGVAEVSNKQSVKNARRDLEENLIKARKY